MIQLFVKSHLVISSITEEKLETRCNAVLEYDASGDPEKMNLPDDYTENLNYIKGLVVKALSKYRNTADNFKSAGYEALYAKVEAADSGGEIFEQIESLQAS